LYVLYIVDCKSSPYSNFFSNYQNYSVELYVTSISKNSDALSNQPKLYRSMIQRL